MSYGDDITASKGIESDAEEIGSADYDTDDIDLDDDDDDTDFDEEE
jgi:hypothetical protein